jgi:flagellar biogenesis protein FliO
MRGKPSKTSEPSSEIRGSQPISGPEQEGKPAAGNQFAFVAKLVIIVGLVLLAFWLLDRAV